MIKEKTRNTGAWTEARFRSFVVSQLRRARWGPKYLTIKNAYIKDGINPKTGRKCKFHLCSSCGGEFLAKEMRADHIMPVVDPAVGFTDWNEYIERMFPEVEGFQAICKGCHDLKTKEERRIRTERKRKEKDEGIAL